MAKAIKFPKKVDFRMDEELFLKLSYIMDKIGAKRGSWCRQAVEQRVENFERDNNVMEEDYERYREAKATTTED